MADWIKVRTNLWDDPRVTAICDVLDRSEAEIIGGLIKLWSMADSHTEDGTLPSITPKAIDRKIGIPGFADAVAGVGWLEVEACGVSIPRFGEHNGKTAKKRAEAAKRMAALRGRYAESEQKANNCEQKRANGVPNTNTSTSTRDVPNGTSPPISPQGGKSRKVTAAELEAAEPIYQAYPRHIAKPKGLEAIAKALRRVPFDELMAAVREYAKSRQGKDPNLTPYPATWFNAERWNDDRTDWFRAERPASGERPRDAWSNLPATSSGDGPRAF